MSRERNHSYLIKCEGCDLTTETDHWTAVKRQAEGWFFRKDGRIYCPNHVPEWVEGWRDAQRITRA